MKTFSLNNQTYSYILLMALGLLVVSCGSYQETSYRDNDGIYSRRVSETVVENTKKESYFADFPVYNVPENDEPVGIFTDIDSYYGDDSYSSGYSGWGNSTSDVTVNVYGGYGGWYGSYWGWRSPYWGWGYGYGWNSWHSPYWGWYGGWGWNSWHNPYWGYGYGWGGYYPYYNNVAYYRGPRGGYYSSDYAFRNGSRTAVNPSNTRSYEVRGRNDNATRTNSRFTPTNSTRTSTLGTSRSATINNSRNIDATRNSTLNNSRNNNSTRNSTINNTNRNNTNRNNTINNSRNNTINNSNRNTVPNRSGSMNSGSNRSSSMGSGSSGGSRSSGMGGGGGSRSSSGGRR